VLSLLHQQGPDLELSRLATQTSLPASSVTGIIDRLVAHGWVHRRRSATDRRRVTATITESGVALLDELAALRNRSLARVLERFTIDEVELLTTFIRRWMAVVEDIDLNPGPETAFAAG
jgi:DNA-binding MarR family transcriptional regulator